MKKFNHVIVRRPCKAMVEGITSGLYPGKPDYALALKEHDSYIEALKQCDVDVTVLEADERYPDSCFVEDPALITSKCAIITNPGAASRNGEKNEILGAIRKFFDDDHIEYIKAPGTLEGGDVMMVGDHFYVGRSARTNEEGIRQLTEILAKYGLTCSEVTLEKVLHLKTTICSSPVSLSRNRILKCITAWRSRRRKPMQPTAYGSTIRLSCPRDIQQCSKLCRTWATGRLRSIPQNSASSTAA